MAVQVSFTLNIEDDKATTQSVMTQCAGRMTEIIRCVSTDEKKVELVDYQATYYEIEEDTE